MLLSACAPILFAVGVAAVVDALITVEWSFPYCNDPQDGPASAVFGAPLPYQRWSGASSLEYDFVPHIYILNIAFLSIVIFLASATGLRRMIRRSRRAGTAIAALGLLLSLCAGGWRILWLSMGMWQPVSSIVHFPYDQYTEYRPVGIAIALSPSYDCTPSRFWFREKWSPPA